MVETGIENGLPKDSVTQLQKLVDDHINIFFVGFSGGPPTKIQPLNIVLIEGDMPVCV